MKGYKGLTWKTPPIKLAHQVHVDKASAELMQFNFTSDEIA
jgi:hypothetical protein